MKNNRGDEQVRAKMDKLDTLSGGIVFGKEEAWEKLQARMEAKPVRRIALRYWVAAAAILLVLVSIISVYNYTPKDLVINSSPAPKELTEKKADNSQTALPEVILPQEKPTPANATTNINGDEKRIAPPVVKNKEERKKLPLVNNIIIETPPSLKQVDKEEKVSNDAPVATVRKPMGVLHINDLQSLNKGEVIHQAEQMQSTASLKTIPVVNLADIVNEEIDVLKIRREDRFSVGYFLRLNDSRLRMPDNNDQRTLFKSKSNSDDSHSPVTDNDLSGYYTY